MTWWDKLDSQTDKMSPTVVKLTDLAIVLSGSHVSGFIVTVDIIDSAWDTESRTKTESCHDANFVVTYQRQPAMPPVTTKFTSWQLSVSIGDWNTGRYRERNMVNILRQPLTRRSMKWGIFYSTYLTTLDNHTGQKYKFVHTKNNTDHVYHSCAQPMRDGVT